VWAAELRVSAPPLPPAKENKTRASLDRGGRGGWGDSGLRSGAAKGSDREKGAPPCERNREEAQKFNSSSRTKRYGRKEVSRKKKKQQREEQRDPPHALSGTLHRKEMELRIELTKKVSDSGELTARPLIAIGKQKSTKKVNPAPKGTIPRSNPNLHGQRKAKLGKKKGETR